MLEFELIRQPETLVEVPGVTPDRLRGMSLDEIRRQPVHCGNQSITLGDVFSVSGDSLDQHHIWNGDLRQIGCIGHQMSTGWIQINGNAGNHVGSRMSGGTIHVAGHVGDFLGSEMGDGLIHVGGDAGDLAGAAYDGGQPGQNGGAILINGAAGNSVGKSMRRGLIVTGGDVGNCCGYLMKAGTIVVFGRVGKNVGLEMTRGTILLMQPPGKRPAGFVPGGTQSMLVASLLRRYLSQLGFGKRLDATRFNMFHGDTLRGGRGELLVAC